MLGGGAGGKWGPQAGCSLSSPSGPRTSSRVPYPPPTPGASSQMRGQAQSHLGAEGRKAAHPHPRTFPRYRGMPKNTQIAVTGRVPGFGSVAGRGSLQNDPPLIALGSGAGGQNFFISTQSGLCTLEGPRFSHLSFTLRQPAASLTLLPQDRHLGDRAVPGGTHLDSLGQVPGIQHKCESGSLPRPAHSPESRPGGFPLLLLPQHCLSLSSRVPR